MHDRTSEQEPKASRQADASVGGTGPRGNRLGAPRHDSPLVSVIELTRSAMSHSAGVEAAGRGSLGASLGEQTMPRWELIRAESTRAAEKDRASASFAGAVNDAIRSSKTQFVMVCSSEARLEPTALEKLFWFLATHERYDFINAHESRGLAGARSVTTRAFFDAGAVVRSHEFGVHVMIRRDAFDALGGFDAEVDNHFGAGACVWDFWLRAAAANRWGSTIAEVLVDRPVGIGHGDASNEAIVAMERAWSDRLAPWSGGRVPVIEQRWPMPFQPVLDEAPASWRTWAPARCVSSTVESAADRRVEDRSCEGSKVRPAGSRSWSDAPRRMLMLIPWMRLGGADKFNLDLCRSLRGRGWSLTIATTVPSPDEWEPRFRELTADIHHPHHLLHWADHPAYLRSLIHTRRPDVVFNSNCEFAYHLMPYLRSGAPEPLYVDYVHMEEDSFKSGGHARHSAGMHDQIDLTMVTSEHLRRWMIERGGEPERLASCPIGVDPREWSPDASVRERVRAELGIAEGTAMIFHAGRICDQKQPAVLGGTLRELARRGVEFRAVVAGDGPDLAWLESFVREHSLGERVRLLGAASPERTRDLMRAADVFFLPSAWEGVALVLYEAMATGAVFVGSDVGGQREIVGRGDDPGAILLSRAVGMGGVEGGGANPIEAESRRYADTIASLLADPGRRARLAASGRARIERGYTHEHLVSSFFASLDRARELQRTRPRTAVSPGLARECAVRAVETLRLEWHVAQLWAERDYWKSAAMGGASSGSAARVSPSGIAVADDAAEVPVNGTWRGTSRGTLRRVIETLRRSPALRKLLPGGGGSP